MLLPYAHRDRRFAKYVQMELYPASLDNDSGGDLTSISVSNGLTGGGQVGDLTISANTSYLQKRIIEQCNTGEYIRGINEDGSIVCETDNDSGGDITSVTAGNGIVGSASNGDVTLSINTSSNTKASGR